jgi:hypothetical protein
VAARALGVTVALGTDWLPSGSVSMPREAACALAYGRAHLGGRLTPRDVWTMMTLNAARAVHVDEVVGAIRPGLAADLILVGGRGRDPYATVIGARPQDLLLVLRGGKALAGQSDVMRVAAAGRQGCEPLAIGRSPHTLCIADDAGKSYRALSQAPGVQGIWPAFFVDAPPIEPPCETADQTPPKTG